LLEGRGCGARASGRRANAAWGRHALAILTTVNPESGLDPSAALRGALSVPRPRTAATPPRLLIAGAGGALGRAVLERALSSGRFASVGVLTEAPLVPGLRGLRALPHDASASMALDADIAVVVFDRGRDYFGRDEAYHLPEPGQLPALAARLRAGGAHTLAVVCPVAPALLPQALQHGLASLDEHAVAGLGFERLMFVRPAQDGPRETLHRRAQRLARWMLSQLHYLVPAREQPVRAESVADFVFEVLRQWPATAPGTRVAGPPLVWAAAQADGPAPVVSRWLGPVDST